MKSIKYFIVFALPLLLINCTKDVVDLYKEPEPTPSNPTDTTATQVELCDTLKANFSANINPIIQTNCATTGCHDSNSPNGNFTNYAGLKVKVDEGKVLQRVVQNKDMPPSGPLPDSEIEKINCWLEAGAPNN